MKKPHLIAIAGIIGVGKTTLARTLAPRLNAHLILEQYYQNPFLSRRHAGDIDAALPVEIYFLMSRAGQLDKKNIISHTCLVCDYIFQKNRIFAELNLSDQQFSIYHQLEQSVIPGIVPPQTVIYLSDSVENCLERITRRGREYEKSISADWLKKLHLRYQQLFDNWNLSQIIRIDCSKHDLRLSQTIDYLCEKL